MNELMQDLADRMRPSEAQVHRALEALEGREGERWSALVALVLPGKTYGVWELGQEVEHLTGVWLGQDVEGARQGYAEARSSAVTAARRALRGRRGTVAHVAVDAAGDWAVFEAPGF